MIGRGVRVGFVLKTGSGSVIEKNHQVYKIPKNHKK